VKKQELEMAGGIDADELASRYGEISKLKSLLFR
jgi:hypothetical protein